MKPGLSISSKPTLYSARRLAIDTDVQFANVLRSPAAENVAAVTASALMAASTFLDFVETFGIPVERFLFLAKHDAIGTDLREAILDYIKSTNAAENK